MSSVSYEQLAEAAPEVGPPSSSADSKAETSMSEWRFCVNFGPVTPCVTPAFSSRHFRRTTGESVLPIETYTTLYERIQTVGNRARCLFSLLATVLFILLVVSNFFLLYLLFTLLSMTIFQGDDGESANADDGGDAVDDQYFLEKSVHVILGYLLLFISINVCRAVSNWISSRGIYPSMNQQLSDLVEEMSPEFQSFGISMGYRPYINKADFSLWPCLLFKARQGKDEGGAPCIWLKGPYHQEGDEEGSNFNDTVQTYPPMFLNLQIPGDVHISEKEFHHSTGYDEKTWTLIKETHKMRTVLPWHVNAVSVLLCVVVVTYCSVLIFIRNTWAVMLGYLAFLLALYLHVRLVDHFWLLPTYKRVAEEVTRMLQVGPDEETPSTSATKGLVVKFENSSIPLRHGFLSRRYELVRAQQQDDDAADAADNEGYEEDLSTLV